MPPSARAAFLVPVSACLLALAAGAAPVSAQRAPGGSVLVATDHWSSEYVRLLRERGYLPELNPLVQPWRAADVALALASLRPDTLPQPVRGWVELLREEYGWRSTSTAPVRWGAAIEGGASASTSQRRDPLRPIGDEGAWPYGRAGAWLEVGPVAAEARLLGDMYYNDDPDGIDPGQRRGGRTDHAYVSADFPVASIQLGRLSRNWFLTRTPGMLVSDVATPYPQIGVEIRAWRFTLRSFTGELETLFDRKRYFSAHRLDYETPNFVVSLGESSLHAPESGALSLRYLNPLELIFFDGENQPNDVTANLMLDLQVWYRLGGVTLYGEGLLDDIDIAPETDEAEPPVYGFTVGGRVTSLAPWLALAAAYQQVSAWAYRTPNDVDRYAYLERGLGQNYSDYDRLTLSADLFPPLRGLRLTPTFQFQRQGEGTFRDTIPGSYQGEPAIFLGVRERTVGVGLAGHYQPIRYAWIAWDVGYNDIANRGNVEGTDESLFSASGRVGLRFDFPWKRPR
jgi:hypothetical protein